MDKKKNDLYKEIEKKAERKTEDILLCLLKRIRTTFDCNIWMESIMDEHILTEDARSGDSTAQYVLSIYWLLKAADVYYPAAKKTVDLLYESLLKYRDTDKSAEEGYAKLCLDTAAYLRERSFDTDIAEALEIEGRGMISLKETDTKFEDQPCMICERMAKEYFEKALMVEKGNRSINEDTFIHSDEGRMMLENFQIAMELGEERAADHVERWKKYL